MQTPDYAIGQAIFVRTDGPEFPEAAIPFQTVGEFVRNCPEPRPEMLLDKVILYAMVDAEPRSVRLRYFSTGKDVRPENLDGTIAIE